MSQTSIVEATSAIKTAARAEEARTEPEREYRVLSRQIDEACDQAERVHLAGGVDCPSTVGQFVMQLQRHADEPLRAPRTARQAHDELMRLSCVLLGRPEDDLEFDREAER